MLVYVSTSMYAGSGARIAPMERPTTGASGERESVRLSPCVCSTLRMVSRAVTQLYDDILRPSGRRVTQFSILATIARSGEANLRQLEAALAIDQATLTRSLSLLHRDRVIERVVVPRQNLIRLAQEHRDPSVRLQAQDPDPEPGWRGATANRRPVAVRVAPIRFTMTARLTSGCPRQLRLMYEKSRCSMVFHLLVPGGKWLVVMVRPVRLASCCSSHFQSRSRAPLLPPASAVM